MKCCRCPLYYSWNNESDKGESCGIFGDGWDSPFQYEDREGTIIGCYLDRHYIEKADAEREEYYASMAESMAQQLNADDLTCSEKTNDCETCKYNDCPWYTTLCDECCRGNSHYEPKTDNGIGCSRCEGRYDCYDRDMPHAVRCNNYGKVTDESQTERSNK